jgi:membrane dipeptidase
MHLLFALLAAAWVIDGHADTPQLLLDDGMDLTAQTAAMVDFPKARAGGLGGEFFAIWVAPGIFAGHYSRRALDLIDAVRGQVDKHPGELMLALTAADVMRAHERHKLAVLMGVEGGHAIEGDLRILRNFFRLGVRYMTLTHTNTNELGDSSGDMDDLKISHHGGLTELGKEAVREMNRLGMLVDVSHVADKTFFDVVEIARAPIIASHSSARALTNHPRNMTDEMLRAVARNGGVVMVNFYSAFVDEAYNKAREGLGPEVEKAYDALKVKYQDNPVSLEREELRVDREFAARIPRPPLKSLIDHLEHVARVAGVDHTGIGSDFDGIPSLPQGIDSAADLPKIAAELRKRGFSQAEVAKIFSGNILRVMRSAEKIKSKIQPRRR